MGKVKYFCVSRLVDYVEHPFPGFSVNCQTSIRPVALHHISAIA